MQVPTQEQLEAAREQGFVNHCHQQGISQDTITEVVENVYRPLADERANTLTEIATSIVNP